MTTAAKQQKKIWGWMGKGCRAESLRRTTAANVVMKGWEAKLHTSRCDAEFRYKFGHGAGSLKMRRNTLKHLQYNRYSAELTFLIQPTTT
uniref:Uncharacterized protein n=1 Tax=Globodera rostochiensis TaxID=31243 RepID=A0A914H365_GLORO